MAEEIKSNKKRNSNVRVSKTLIWIFLALALATIAVLLIELVQFKINWRMIPLALAIIMFTFLIFAEIKKLKTSSKNK